MTQYFYVLTAQWTAFPANVTTQTVKGTIDTWDENPQVMYETAIKMFEEKFNIGKNYAVLFYNTWKM